MERAMAERSPLRQPVQPVEFYPQSPAPEPAPQVKPEFPESNKKDGAPSQSDATSPKRTVEPNVRTVRANGVNERSNRTVEQSSVLTELAQGIDEDKRGTERYSFEIFSDQKERIEELQYQYKRKTGKRLSSSRILREALEEYLEKALRALQ